MASIRAQSAAAEFDVTVILGIDPGERARMAPLAERLGVRLAESPAASQSAALNAALREADSEYVSFLEDDDTWHPHYLEAAHRALSLGADFVSSTQLEIDENEVTLRINDFPTPSGWTLTRATLAAVGGFDESYRFHLDNEWLGRLGDSGARRLHLVESTAPVEIQYLSQVRPWLLNVIQLSGGHCRLARHDSAIPLVRRLVHSASGMARIARDPQLTQVSRGEIARLQARFGRIPW